MLMRTSKFDRPRLESSYRKRMLAFGCFSYTTSRDTITKPERYIRAISREYDPFPALNPFLSLDLVDNPAIFSRSVRAAEFTGHGWRILNHQ